MTKYVWSKMRLVKVARDDQFFELFDKFLLFKDYKMIKQKQNKI